LDPFLANAADILEAARSCARAGAEAVPWTIVLGASGQIEMLADSSWSLEALRTERGAAMVFRVAEDGGRVAVTGRDRSRSCRLEAEPPAVIARRLLSSRPVCTIVQPALPAISQPALR
jgi:hypothetical protein